jgi:hypothetical protein
MDKKEIDRELEHQKTILNSLRDNYRNLELQEVKFGLSVPPHILSELQRVSERIRQVIDRISELQTQAAQDQLSLAEAEYRRQAAIAWRDGFLTVEGSAELELMRLRQGIAPDRAEHIESEIREATVEQIFRTLEIDLLFGIQNHDSLTSGKLMHITFTMDNTTLNDSSITIDQSMAVLSAEETAFKNIGKCIILNAERTLFLLTRYIKPFHLNNIDNFTSTLIQINRVSLFPSEEKIYNHFIDKLKSIKQQWDINATQKIST